MPQIFLSGVKYLSMAIEKWYLRPTKETIMTRPPDSCRWKYVVVKETYPDPFSPPVIQTFPGVFTLGEKVGLEALSEKVNRERNLKGIE